MIAIVDYDAGNLKSVQKALGYLGKDAIITRDDKEILSADHVILPGVGAYGDAMCRLKEYGLDEILKEVAARGIPFLGICLGLQLIFEHSEENGGADGLGLMKGQIVKIPDAPGLKIPHMGWNSISINPKSRLLAGIPDGSYVYFVHSYYLRAQNRDEVAATTEYGVKIDAAVEKDNLFACQFHPEKSGEVGLKILTNFIGL